MIEAKFLLFLFFWTDPAATETQPKWTSDAFISFESCEAEAAVLREMLRDKHGENVRIEYQCVHRENFNPL